MKSQEELADLFHNKSFQVEDLLCLSSKVCQVKLTALPQRQKISHKTNCAITAFNAAYSRIEMHKDIELLLHAGMTPMYFDTDAIIWSQRESTPSPLIYGASFGQYKNEIDGKINSFYSLGKEKK